MGSNDILIVGGIALLAGAWLLYPDMFAGLIPAIPGAEGAVTPGGEFIGGGGETSGEFIVEDTPNPTGSCKSQFNGKCKTECATDKFAPRCQECISLCGGTGTGTPGQCFSVGKDKHVLCGSTANQCRTINNTKICLCGSNVKGNKVRDNRPFHMGGNRTCPDCVTYCKTGAAPKVLNPTTPSTTYPRSVPGQPSNCKQNSASSYVWTSSGKTATGNSCQQARSFWLQKHSSTSRPAEPVKKTKSCNTGDKCNWNPGGLNKKCSCGCAGGSWNIGHNTPCSQCETACRARRRQAGYSNAAFYFEDAAEQYLDNGQRFANMVMAV